MSCAKLPDKYLKLVEVFSLSKGSYAFKQKKRHQPQINAQQSKTTKKTSKDCHICVL